MKTIKFLTLTVLVVLIGFNLVSCSKDDEPDSITLSVTEQSVAYSTNTFSVTVTANGEWTASSDQSWCKVSPANGTSGTGTLTVSCEENPTYDTRNATITIIRGTAKSSITVTQSQRVPYLTFSADAEQTLTMSKAVNTLEYSLNESEWKELGTNTVTFGGTNGNLKIRGKNLNGTSGKDSEDYSKIVFGNATKVSCSGDIRTLLDYENYRTVDTSNARFLSLFEKCAQLITAPELPATVLADGCYAAMFTECTSLKEAPELPATTLAQDCYMSMFFYCISMDKAPKLPAEKLTEGCYNGMFQSCKSLTTAPELPAVELAKECYGDMFNGCPKLNYIKMMATDISADDCLAKWLDGVAATGTFIKNKNATWDESKVIPTGWTVTAE